MSDTLQQLNFNDLQGWAADDHAAAMSTFRLTARRHLERPLRSRSLTPLDGFERVARASLEIEDSDAARAFFEANFTPFLIGDGKLTGYYEPVFSAARERTAEHTVPLHARPPELVDIYGSTMRYGLMVDGEPRPYHDRAAIQAGALDGRGLEIAWVRDPVDAFVIHIQGSARLELTDGSTLRVGYAAKSGHPYTSLGKVLLHRLQLDDPSIKAGDITADRLTAWMRAHPAELPDFLAQNRSYIFFAASADDGTQGPVGAAKVPLTGGRSLAVDRNLHSFGLPYWLETERALPDASAPMNRLLVAQDTGSAILGPARGDLFIGSGEAAGSVAGRVNHATRFVALMPDHA